MVGAGLKLKPENGAGAGAGAGEELPLKEKVGFDEGAGAGPGAEVPKENETGAVAEAKSVGALLIAADVLELPVTFGMLLAPALFSFLASFSSFCK